MIVELYDGYFIVEILTKADDTSVVDLSFDESRAVEISRNIDQLESIKQSSQRTHVLLPTSRTTPP